MGGLSYFAHYLEATGLFEHLVETCPLAYLSNNAPNKRDVLGEILLSVLDGSPAGAGTMIGFLLGGGALGALGGWLVERRRARMARDGRAHTS